MQFYTFKNVRYAKAPVGARRFARPEYPAALADPSELQDSTYGPACHQIATTTCDCPPADCPANTTARPQGFLHAQTLGATSEDCLFLDLYVPESALAGRNASRQAEGQPFGHPHGAPNASLPVVVWFHGGGYVSGAKDSQDAGVPLYNGTGLLSAARHAGRELIFVACNYRLGAFGWTAGPSVEADALPNAGLHDQRLVLRWVRDFVHLVGGNPARVSAWGQSAGGGSILHHLLAEDGSRDPLFSRAVVLSPGYEWQFDRGPDGPLEAVYRNLSTRVGCKTDGLDCLRAQSEAVLAKQSQALFDEVKCDGKVVLGPAVAGQLIRQLPMVSCQQGKVWRGLASIVVSHVADETSAFVPKFVTNETDFRHFLLHLLPQPDLDLVRELVADRYGEGDARNRTAALLRDAFITCAGRQLVDAYERSRGHYLMQYDFLAWLGLAVHAADLLPLFWNEDFDIATVIAAVYPSTPRVVVELVAATFATYARRYQSYFVSHAAAQSPSDTAREELPTWSQTNVTDDGLLGNVMEAGWSLFGNYFNNATVDKLMTRSSCDFWAAMAEIIDQKYSGDGASSDPERAFRVQRYM